MLTRNQTVNMLAAIMLMASVAASANAGDASGIVPCREQNYSLLVAGDDTVPGRKPLKIVEMPKAEYSETAYRAGIFGKVTLSVRFLAGGRIGTIEIIKGLPGGLTEEAVKAARRIRFIPARQDGRLTNTAQAVDYYFADPRTCSLQ